MACGVEAYGVWRAVLWRVVCGVVAWGRITWRLRFLFTALRFSSTDR